jgi:hypothetical protein
MTDIDKAAERVREAIETGDMLALAIQIVNSLDTFPPYTINNLLADVVKAKTAGRVIEQAYAAQAAEIEAAWKMIEAEFDIEPRAQIEAEAKTNGFKYGLAQAVHTIWKRDAKVTELAAELAELRAKLEAAKKEAALRSDMIDSDCMAAINTLRMNEGNSVTLICDNPDFGGPNNAIECSGDWTNWQTKRFTGDRLLTSLQSALKEYFAWHGEECEPPKKLTALRTAAAPFEDGSEITVEWCLANGAKHLTNDIYRWRFPGRPVVEWSAKSGRTFMHERCIGTLDLGAMNHLLASLKPGGVK